MTLIFLIYGLFIGSFLNVCIFRIPAGISSIVKPPYSCGSCGHRLNFIDMLPVVNYIANRGKCMCCGEGYSLQYPLIELLNGILYALVYLKYGFSLTSVIYCIIISILVVISFIDLKHKIIPDGANIALAVVGAIFIFIERAGLYNSFLGSITGFGLFLAIAFLTNAMGGGDIKLMAALGFLFGMRGVLFITLTSFVSGAIISLILLGLKIKSRKDEIPFGPFIALAALTYIFFGTVFINWYINIFI